MENVQVKNKRYYILLRQKEDKLKDKLHFFEGFISGKQFYYTENFWHDVCIMELPEGTEGSVRVRFYFNDATDGFIEEYNSLEEARDKIRDIYKYNFPDSHYLNQVFGSYSAAILQLISWAAEVAYCIEKLEKLTQSGVD